MKRQYTIESIKYAFYIWALLGAFFFIAWFTAFINFASHLGITNGELFSRSPIIFYGLLFLSGPIIWALLLLVLLMAMFSYLIPILFA